MGSVRAAKAAVLVLMLATAVVWGRVGQSDGGGGIVSDQGAPAASNAPLAFTPWPPAVVERDALVQPFEESGAATLPDAFAPRTASATQAPVEGPVSTPQPATSTEVAQSVEQPPVKRQDAGSNPALGATPTPTPTPPVPASNGPSTASNGSSTASDGSSTASDYPSPVPAPTPSTLRAAIEAAFPPSEWERAHRIAMCESGGNPAAIGRLGERGAFQVRPEYHGPVPADLHGQAQQAARIWREQGWRPWSCR